MVRGLVALGLAVAVGYAADVDLAAVKQALLALPPPRLALVGALAAGNQLLYAERWRRLLVGDGPPPPPWHVLFRHTMVSGFLGLVAPGGAQLLVQGALTRRQGAAPAEPWAVLIAERVIGLALTPMLAGLALLFLPGRGARAALPFVLGGGVLLALVAAGPAAASRMRRVLPAKVCDVLVAVGPRMRRPDVVGLAALAQAGHSAIALTLILPLGGARAGDVVAGTMVAQWAGVLPQAFGIGPGQVALVTLFARAGAPLDGATAAVLAWWAIGLLVALSGGLALIPAALAGRRAG